MWFSLTTQLSFGFKGNTDLMVTNGSPARSEEFTCTVDEERKPLCVNELWP